MWGYLKRKKWREKRGTCPTTSLSIQSFCCLKWSWRNNSRTYPLRNERWWILRTSIYDLRLWYTAHFASLLYYCRLIECVILQHICWVKVRPPYSHQSLSNLMVATLSSASAPEVLRNRNSVHSCLDILALAVCGGKHHPSLTRIDVSAYFRDTLRWQITRFTL